MMENITLEIDGQRFNVLSLQGSEYISRPFLFKLDILARANIFVPHQYLLHKAILRFNKRVIVGIITQSSERALKEDQSVNVTFTLEPRYSLSKCSVGARVTLNKSLPEIIKDNLIALGYEGNQIKFFLQREYLQKSFWLQAVNECNFDFLHRQMQKYGMFYWFSTENTGAVCEEVICFADSNDYDHVTTAVVFNDKDVGVEKRIAFCRLGQVFAKSGSISAETGRASKIKAKCNYSDICCAQFIDLDAGGFALNSSGIFIVEQIQHHFAQCIEGIGDAAPYCCSVLLHPRTVPLQVSSALKPLLPVVFTGHIESDSSYALLNECGQYKVKFRFDCDDKINANSSLPIARLSSHQGLHTPLHNNQEVLLGMLNGDPDTPIIIGVATNDKNRSVVNVSNSSESLFRSASGNEIKIDDACGHKKVQLSTRSQNNILSLNACNDRKGVIVHSQNGGIQAHAGGKVNIGGDNIHFASANSCRSCCGRNYYLNAVSNSSLQAHKFLSLKSGADIVFHADYGCSFKSGGAFKIIAKKKVAFTSGKYGVLIGGSGDVKLKAHAGSVVLRARNTVEIRHKSAGLTLLQGGGVELYGKRVAFMATGGVIPCGKINRISSVTAASNAVKHPLPQHIPDVPIYALASSSEVKQSVDLTLELQVAPHGKSGCDYFAAIYYKITADDIYAGVSDGALIRVRNFASTRVIQIELTDYTQKQLIYIAAINGKNIPAASLIKISMNDLRKVRDNSYKLTLKILAGPLIANIRNSNKNCDKGLTQQQLKYIQANGANAVLFVHGFNLPYTEPGGYFGRQIKDVAFTALNSPLATEQSNVATGNNTELFETIYRSKQWLQQNFPALNPWPDYVDFNLDQNETLNGAGVQSWFVNMENNLNLAAGKYDGNDYSKFTRILNVTWSSYSENATDYMAIVERTKAAGERLAKIVRQLRAANISINIIAHSLGNSVLLHAMNNSPKNSIENAFMWEAAVPNNVLADARATNGPTWDLKNAHEAAKKIVVLYSKNDNVLGPIPGGQINQIEINMCKPADELLPALLFRECGLGSVYELAMWVGAPLSDIFNLDSQERIYRQWRELHRDAELAPTLETQMLCDRFGSYFERRLKMGLQNITKKIEQELHLAKHPSLTAIFDQHHEKMSWLKILLSCDYSFKNSREYYGLPGVLALRRAAALLNIMMQDVNYTPRHALGYSGPDKDTKLLLGGKLVVCDQSRWLWSHSAMKCPTDEIMNYVYKKIIIRSPGFRFGNN